MGQSHVKRRERERALRRHKPVITRELERVCAELGLDPASAVRRQLVDEVVRFASPYAFRGIDAVLPAERLDLIRLWLRWRLTGHVETRDEIQRAARRIAPLPNHDFSPGPRCFGDPTSAEVRSAHASRHRRQARREGGGRRRVTDL